MKAMHPTDKKILKASVVGMAALLLLGFVVGTIVGFCICQLFNH
jgi:uncharacterized membrane-anchored protein YhcB (DUF1043 family)